MSELERDRRESAPTTVRLILWMVFLVVVGMPMVYVLWSALNRVMLGDLGGVRWGLVLPVLLVFLGYLYLLARLVRRWEAGE